MRAHRMPPLPPSTNLPWTTKLRELRREYLHCCSQQTSLRQADFHHGTYRITRPGLYTLQEDVLFNPTQPPDPQHYPSAAYSMGFFAAITIECDNVILDLNHHSIAQHPLHYAKQRFFSIIELANQPFIPGQGPGSINSTANPLLSARHCHITNGTLGLSSHSSIHGNNNSHIWLDKLQLQEFEVTGIQLNGVQGAFIDHSRSTPWNTSP